MDDVRVAYFPAGYVLRRLRPAVTSDYYHLQDKFLGFSISEVKRYGPKAGSRS